jgi:hypothetical protein
MTGSLGVDLSGILLYWHDNYGNGIFWLGVWDEHRGPMALHNIGYKICASGVSPFRSIWSAHLQLPSSPHGTISTSFVCVEHG